MNATVKFFKSQRAPDNGVVLSPREWEVMLATCRGESAKEISERLGISHKTVSTFRERIRRKSGAKNTVEMALFAFRQGLVQ